MLFKSAQVGGDTEAGRAVEMQSDGQRITPDVRFVVTSKPIGPMTTSKETAARSKLITLKDGEPYRDINGREIQHLISGIGSSSLVDTDGDVFHKNCIDGMAKDAIDLNVLLNHVPTLPWSIAGSILEAETDYLTTHSGENHCVLKLVSDIEEKHPEAWRTYEMIAGIDCRPRKLGFSVGCLYVDVKPRQTKSGLYHGHDVFEVLPVEFSIVSMPANRLAWIDTIAYDLQEKGVFPKTDAFKHKGLRLKRYAQSQEVVERITDWMDFGPVDGPKLEKLATVFEKRYGIIYAKRPRSA